MNEDSDFELSLLVEVYIHCQFVDIAVITRCTLQPEIFFKFYFAT